MQKFKLRQNRHQTSKKDGWHVFRKLRHHTFTLKNFGQHLLTLWVNIFTLNFPWNWGKWHFFHFSIGSRVNKSQQVLTKKFFVEKYGIWAFYIRVEHYFITLITHSMISLRFAYFLRQNLSEKRWKFFFVKNSARQHLLTKCKLCWWKHMGWAPLTL